MSKSGNIFGTYVYLKNHNIDPCAKECPEVFFTTSASRQICSWPRDVIHHFLAEKMRNRSVSAPVWPEWKNFCQFGDCLDLSSYFFFYGDQWDLSSLVATGSSRASACKLSHRLPTISLEHLSLFGQALRIWAFFKINWSSTNFCATFPTVIITQ
jgi:hypothetical protein